MSQRVTRPVCLADYERLAHQRLDANALAFFAGGAADEITLRWNREAFDNLALSPRVLRGGGGAHTRVELFGRDYRHPIFVAPMALQKLAHTDGEIATAIAAEAQNAGMVLSAQASVSLEDAAKAGATCRWFQLYIQPTKAATMQLVRRAEDAGFEVLVVTADAPVSGVRTRVHRAGFHLPPGIAAVNLLELPPIETPALGPEASVVLDHFVAIAPTWDDIAWLKSQTRLPIVLKGILTAEDTARVLELGLDGIIVSNHGGRTLDTLPATIDVLPEIAAAVAGRIRCCGRRRATRDGHSQSLGPRRVRRAHRAPRHIRSRRRRLRSAWRTCCACCAMNSRIAMALTGCRTLADIGPHLLRASARGGA
ncbi:MAG: alpha-hydroxy acid oxidase [Hyphomicrobium sp.]